MSVRRWAYIAFGLFALCSLGFAAGALPGGAAARDSQAHIAPSLYTYNPGGVFSFDVEASVPLTTPTPFPTFTPTGLPDLYGAFWSTQNLCSQSFSIELTTYANPWAGAGPSTMRLQNRYGEYVDYPVPAFTQPGPYQVHCNPCVAPSYPMTLTVDVFNDVIENNEANNTYVDDLPPPTGTPCITPSPTRTATPTRSPTSTTPTPSGQPDLRPYINYSSGGCSGPGIGELGTFEASSGDAGPSTMRYQDEDGDQIDFPVPAIPAGGHYSVTCESCFYSSRFPITLTVDISNTVVETNENNNILTASYIPPAGSHTPCPPTSPPTLTATRTPTASATSTRTHTATASATSTGEATSTFTATPVQPTSCAISFTDVPQDNTFYPFVRCLACRQIVAGYSDGTFRPNNHVTRGQLAKIVSNSAGLAGGAAQQTFEDVPVSSTFHLYIERLVSQGVMGGYPCGGTGEPCIPPGDRPYFRPNANATRGQISKIVSNARGYNDPVSGQIFEDVPPGSAFYEWVQRLASRGIMGGYRCGGAGEPCGTGNKPYFRPNNNATRGQVSKIVANTFFPGCEMPSRP